MFTTSYFCLRQMLHAGQGPGFEGGQARDPGPPHLHHRGVCAGPVCVPGGADAGLDGVADARQQHKKCFDEPLALPKQTFITDEDGRTKLSVEDALRLKNMLFHYTA